MKYLVCGSTCRCRAKCFSKISEGDRTEMFRKFYDFTTKNEQDAYLQALIECNPVTRRRPRANQENAKPKSHTFKYSVSSSSGKFNVCKAAFIGIYAVTTERVRRLSKLLSLGKSPADKRGKQTSGNAKPGEVVRLIEDHIRSFPVKRAHYTNRDYQYLSEKLDIKKMHQLLLEKYPGFSVKYSFYRQIFREKFSLCFGRPQVDTCCTCEELGNKIKSKSLNDVAKRVAVAEKVVHQRRAKKFFTKMDSIQDLCRTDPSVGGICIDYMQNLCLPSIPVQDTFYLHQLTVNVFNIHNLKSGQSFFYIYHEGLGKKGPNEVCSFVMDYIKREIPETVTHFHIFSDGCGGQNKNHCVIRMCRALVDLGRFKTVNQYFPIRGHSFMPCDRNFAVVKKKIKKNDRIFLLKEYAELIITSSSKGNFSVYLMEEDNSVLKNYKKWWPQYYKKNCLSTASYGRGVPKDQKVSFNISNFMQFSHIEDTKGHVLARDYIDGITEHEFKVNTSNEITSFPDELAYPDVKLPISAKKMVSIKKFQRFTRDKEELIRNFYQEIFSWPTVGGENEDVTEY